MTEHNKAQLSALMDGDLDDMAVKKLLEDKSIRQSWHRYHVISDVLQNRIPLNIDPQLTLRISELIKSEPAIVAPSRRNLLNYLKPVAGTAIAASVAALAILGVQQYRTGTVMPETMVIAASNSPIQAPINQVGIPIDTDNVRPVQQVIQGQLIQTNNMNNVQMSRYILNHNEYQSNTGVYGAVPHVRLVATERK